MTPFTLDLIGGFRASLGPRTLAFSKKAQALLAYLALSRAGGIRARGSPICSGVTGPKTSRATACATRCSRSGSPSGQDGRGSSRSIMNGSSAWPRRSPWMPRTPALAAEGTLAALEQAARLCRGDLLEGIASTRPRSRAG